MTKPQPTLQLSHELQLPLDAVTMTFAILAIRGAGKTYTAAVLVEAMLQASQQVIVIDPTGAWWGLRAGADGKSEGLPIVVLGGDHGDLPLSPDAGELIAELVVSERLSVVIDTSLMRKGEQLRFATAFFETLYRKNRQPLHLVIDEGDAFAPQKPYEDAKRCLGAVEDLVRRGRIRGIGTTLVTQRSAVLNKDVLTQTEALIVLRTTGAQDIAAISEWVRLHGTEEQWTALKTSLPSLPTGTAWFWSPAWLGIFKRVQIQKRITFNSSATPKVGETVRAPAKLAAVDLDRIRTQIEVTNERRKEQDPKELLRQLAEVKKQLAQNPPQIQRAEVPSLTPEDRSALIESVTSAFDLARSLEESANWIKEAAHQIKEAARKVDAAVWNDKARKSWESLEQKHPEIRGLAAPALAPAPRTRAPASGELSKYARELLDTLARHHPMVLTRSQLALLSGKSLRSSSFETAVSELRRGGHVLIEGKGFSLADASLAKPAPTDPAQVRGHWLGVLPEYERALLNALFESWPNPVPRAALATLAGKSATSSSFETACSTLVRNGLVTKTSEGLRPVEWFFEFPRERGRS